MQVTEHTHAIKIPFKLSIGQGKMVDRFVYAYLIYGKRICLIDCGVSSSEALILDYVKKTGRDPHEISMIIHTHCHPDHIGGSYTIKRISGCRVAAHIEAKPWIEDIERQYEERPIENFHSLVRNSVGVDLVLRDGDSLNVGDGLAVKVLHTPGHSRGSISLLFNEDGALFSGDAIPVAGDPPIYEDILSSVSSIRKLRQVEGLKVLFSSWADPQRGNRIYESMDQGLGYLQRIHEAVRKINREFPAISSGELCIRVLRNLGLPGLSAMPIVIKSIEAHLKASGHKDLLKL